MTTLASKSVDPNLVFVGYNLRTAGQELESNYMISGDPYQRYPWIKVGHVYTNVAAEPGGAWLALAAHLINNGVRKIRLLTGRHGDLINNNGKVGYPHFADEDRKRVSEINKGSSTFRTETESFGNKRVQVPSGTHIELVDMSKYGSNQAPTIKQQVQLARQQGEVVILAWCFSLYSFNSWTDSEQQQVVDLAMKDPNCPIMVNCGSLFGKSYNAHMATVNFDSSKAPYTSKLYRESILPVRNIVMNSWTWVNGWDS